MTDPLDRIRDAVRALDFVDERLFEENTTLHVAWEEAFTDKKPLDVERVQRVRETLPKLVSALATAAVSIDRALREYNEQER
jgi:hypothetical protein